MPIDWSQYDVVEMPDGSRPQAAQDWSQYDVVDKPPQAWGDVGSRALRSAPGSAVDYGRNVLQAVLNPVDTAATGINAINGAMQNMAGSNLGMNDQRALADAIGKFYSDRYGGWENIKESIATDPVGVLADASTPFTVGGGAIKAMGAAGRLGRAGSAMSAAGRMMEPVSLAGKGAYLGTLTLADRLLPESLMASALKMKTSLPPAERAQIVETLLKNRVTVTDKGADKIGSKISRLQGEIGPMIQAADEAGQFVDPYSVASRLDDVYPKYNTVTRRASQAPIDRAKTAFIAENTIEMPTGERIPVAIPISKAQAKKINTYRENAGAYESTSRTSAEKDALKALARGLKEEIESAVPGVGPVNADLSRLIPAQEWVNRALGRSGNWNPVGIGGLMGAATGNIPAMVATEAARAPGVLSKAAIAGDILRRYGSPLMPNAATRATAGGLMRAIEDQ